MGDRVGAGEGYTGYYPRTIPGSHIELILSTGPYPRPNEGNSHVTDEVSQIWPQIDLRITSELTSE